MKKIMMAVAVVATLGLAACGSQAKAADNFWSNFWGDSNNSARGEGNTDAKAGGEGKFSMTFEGKAMTEGNMDAKAGGVGNNSATGNARGVDK
jgi:hypothetical protein